MEGVAEEQEQAEQPTNFPANGGMDQTVLPPYVPPSALVPPWSDDLHAVSAPASLVAETPPQPQPQPQAQPSAQALRLARNKPQPQETPVYTMQQQEAQQAEAVMLVKQAQQKVQQAQQAQQAQQQESAQSTAAQQATASQQQGLMSAAFALPTPSGSGSLSSSSSLLSSDEQASSRQALKGANPFNTVAMVQARDQPSLLDQQEKASALELRLKVVRDVMQKFHAAPEGMTEGMALLAREIDGPEVSDD